MLKVRRFYDEEQHGMVSLLKKDHCISKGVK